ncbi:hypothetical protein H0S70_02440 [Chryseobacterium manosquense]|uniref:Uncharacterized protein n=1 Tax=Chryseobacterium manosquense TaxID=2754694 RepID=A0A7H1DY10_9FLAO|nr:hypothetical protein [Chryseobacterium manosquense]QNS41868.1 hypothetical protein H0S70_02440 [Chryseobacterium manosquense]
MFDVFFWSSECSRLQIHHSEPTFCEKQLPKKANLNNFEIITHDFSKSMNADVVKVQQSFNGIPVYNALATALISRSLKCV